MLEKRIDNARRKIDANGETILTFTVGFSTINKDKCSEWCETSLHVTTPFNLVQRG